MSIGNVQAALSGSIVDLDHGLAGRVQQGPVLVEGVARPQLRSDRQHHVGSSDDVVGGSTTRTVRSPRRHGVGLGEHALSARRGGDRRVYRLGQAGQAGLGPGQADPVAGHDHRARRPARTRRRRSSASWSTLRWGQRQVGARWGRCAAPMSGRPGLQGAAVVDDRNRPRLSGQGVFQGELGVLDGLRRV